MRVGRPIQSYVRITQRFNPPAHHGVDLSAYVGTPVYATVDGTAFGHNQPQGFGIYVRIETPEAKVYAAHLDRIAISSGQRVSRGQIIGFSGNTGNSTGPHLHFEIRRNAGSPFRYGAIDPWPRIDWYQAPSGRRAVGVHLGKDCTFSGADRRVIETLRPGHVTVLPDYSMNPQPVGPAEISWILSLLPDCHLLVRPHISASEAATDKGCQEYITAVIALLSEWTKLVPKGQLHLQLWNEPNRSREDAEWTGFGNQEADMPRFDKVFCEGYTRVKEKHPDVIIGWTPLAMGHRDVWFTGNPASNYYLHGAGGCHEPHTLTYAAWDQARRQGPCYKSLSLADELYAHVYVHNRNGTNDAWGHPAYGLRYERMRYWWPDKPIWLNEYGVPERSYIDQPGGTSAIVNGTAYIAEQVPYINGLSLWTLGNNPDWGGEIYHRNGHPIPLVYELAQFNGITVSPPPLPPQMNETEIGTFVSDLLQDHILPLNTKAALYKAAKIRNPNLTPASDECRPHELNIELPTGLPDNIVCQAFRNPQNDAWQEIAWTRIGEWAPNQIRWVQRQN